jgi:hypothetical protein
MSSPVLADAQFGIAKILRPYNGCFDNAKVTTTDGSVTIPAADGTTTVSFSVANATGIAVGSGIVITDGADFRGCLVTAVSGNVITVLNTGTFGVSPSLAATFGAGSKVTFGGSYQWMPGSCPLMFSESGIALDDLAGTPGYSPTLVRGLSVSMGARVMIWLPNFQLFGDGEGASDYKWGISWRLRNTYDFRVARRAYHYPKQSPGVPDTSAPVGMQDRVVIPAAWNAVLYNGTSPSSGYPSVTNAYTEFLKTHLLSTDSAPLSPNGLTGVMQQGVQDVEFDPTAAVCPTYQIVETQALGDELLIGLYKGAPTPTAQWNFDVFPPGPDFQLAFLLGNYPDLGVYVMTGSAP